MRMSSNKIKLSLCTATLLVAGAAMAQGTQPNANVANPAMGAGQQSQQGTPMGTTGVSTPAPGTTTQPMPMNSPGGTTNPTPATSSSGAGMDAPMRPARADRN